MKKIILLTLALVAMTSTVLKADYPTSSYELEKINGDLVLKKWKGSETEIDLSSDSKLKKIERIGPDCFKNNTTLKKIVFSKEVKWTGDCAFERCTALKEVELNESIELIGRASFDGCVNLRKINFPDAITAIRIRAFFDCEKLTGDLKLPENLKWIGAFAFHNTGYNGTLTFGSKLLEIEKSAFKGCGFTGELKLPQRLKEIEHYAFEGCSGFTKIFCHATDPPKLGINVFDDIITEGDKRGVLHVPAESVELYRAQESWSKRFKRIVPIDFAVAPCIISDDGRILEKWYGPDTILNMNKYPELKEVIIIGKKVFASCKHLKSIIIADAVEEIRKEAFLNCESLRTLTIPQSVETIGESAFADCLNLTTVTMGDGVKEIGKQAFHRCRSLISLNIPQNVETIGEDAFSGCSKLEQISVAEANTHFSQRDDILYNKAQTHLVKFPENKGIKEFAFPETLQTIGVAAVRSQRHLRFVKFLGNIHMIGERAFRGCKELAHVICEGTSTEPGEEAFRDIKSNATLIVKGENAWSYMDKPSWTEIFTLKLSEGDCDLNFKLSDKGKTLSEWVGPNSEQVKLYMNAHPVLKHVTKIGAQAFESSSKLHTLQLAEGVERIEKHAFKNCSQLDKIILSNSLQTIDVGAFWDAPNLREIDASDAEHFSSPNYELYSKGHKKLIWSSPIRYHEGVGIDSATEEIEELAFHNNTSIERLSMQKEIKKIGNNAFKGCTNIVEVTCRAAAPPELGQNVFQDISSSATLYVPFGSEEKYKQNTGWGGAFYDIKTIESTILYKLADEGKTLIRWSDRENQLEELDMQNDPVLKNVTKLAKNAFYSCSNLKKLILPEGLIEVEHRGLSSMANLVALELPKNLTTLAEGAIVWNGSLTNLTVASQNKNFVVVDGVLFNSEKTRLIFWPHALKKTAYTAPNTLKTIDGGTFAADENLKEVILPASVTEIGAEAFFYCHNIEKFTCHATRPPTVAENTFGFMYYPEEPSSSPSSKQKALKNRAFRGIEQQATLFVPAASVAAYKAHKIWSKPFKPILAVSAAAVQLLQQDNVALWSQEGVIYIKSKHKLSVVIYDLTGKELFREEVLGEKSVQLPAGVYYIVNIDKKSYKIMNR